MSAATVSAARKSSAAGRREAEHHGRSDCQNVVVNPCFHSLGSFFLVSNQSWAMKGDISNIGWCSV
jgi:hypothetical protein